MKQKLQYLIYPDGIMYNKENDSVRTTKVNILFSSIPLLARDLSKKNGDNLKKDYPLGCNVGETARQCMPLMR